MLKTLLRRGPVARAGYLIPILFLGSATFTFAAVTNVSGTFQTFGQLNASNPSVSDTLTLSGVNFSLTASLNQRFPQCGVPSAYGTQDFTVFSPNGGFSLPSFDITPTIPPCVLNATLTYNGQTYTNLVVTLNFSGPSEAVPSNVTPGESMYFYGGSISNVAFIMTGAIDVYPNTAQQNPVPLFSIPVASTGLFSASGTGSIPNTLPGPSGSQYGAIYQLSASPVGFATDTTTQGAWSNLYGTEGYLIANGPASQPSYVAVKVNQASTFTYALPSNDPRALQDGPGAATNIASAYSANKFNISFAFTDTFVHRVALYLLDYDTSSRSETLTVTDNITGTLLDTEAVSNFHNGTYAIFNLRGNETITVTSASATPAVVSGIFFGPTGPLYTAPGPATATASLYKTDTTTQGLWYSAYGSSGYLIANGLSSSLAAASVTLVGDSTYTWASQTTDPRALKTNFYLPAPGIASAYTQYPSQSFAIKVYAYQPQKLSLYLLDWDNEGRSETVTISDLVTGTVLSVVPVSNFQSGVYYTWTVSGNVNVTVTPTNGTSPAVSGIFFN